MANFSPAETRPFSPRAFCWTCRQPEQACYCSNLRPFDPGVEFVILIHKIESRRRIATGRMAHLSLKSSHLIEGDAFDDCEKVNRLLARSDAFPMVLYPGRDSLNLSALTSTEICKTWPVEKKPMIFVIDGTWATARRTMRLSTKLSRLPRISFSPTRESQFKVRKQPAPHCLSTIEAIHQMIELIHLPSPDAKKPEFAARAHDTLLHVFESMVQRQLKSMNGRKSAITS